MRGGPTSSMQTRRGRGGPEVRALGSAGVDDGGQNSRAGEGLVSSRKRDPVAERRSQKPECTIMRDLWVSGSRLDSPSPAPNEPPSLAIAGGAARVRYGGAREVVAVCKGMRRVGPEGIARGTRLAKKVEPRAGEAHWFSCGDICNIRVAVPYFALALNAWISR